MKWELAVLIVVLLVSGCTNQPESETSPATEEKMEKIGNRHAILDTEKGAIKIELYEERAPISTKNFVSLIESGFYENMVFHRVVPGFVIQTGDPTGTGTSGSDNTIPLEIHPDLRHVKGAVGMARTNDPNSATSQFYITLSATPNLDDQYAVFGIVVDGMDVVESIKQDDRLNGITFE